MRLFIAETYCIYNNKKAPHLLSVGGLLSIFSKSAYHSVCKPVAVDNLLRVTAVVAVGSIINRYGGRTDIAGIVYQDIALNPFT